jgi:hypothetical protein
MQNWLDHIHRGGEVKTVHIWVVLGLLIVAGLAGLLIWRAPRRYVTAAEIEIDAQQDTIFDAISHATAQLAWSTWASGAGRVWSLAGTEGEPGARIEFRDRQGALSGEQTLVETHMPKFVCFQLALHSPQRLVGIVTYEILAQGSGRSRVKLRIAEETPRPANLPALLLRRAKRRQRQAHSDLAALKRYCEEQPERISTYTG